MWGWLLTKYGSFLDAYTPQKSNECFLILIIIFVLVSPPANQVKFFAKRSCYTPFLRTFRAGFNHVIIEMIARPKMEGSQSSGTLSQALLPVSAVTKRLIPLSLLPKQAGRLGPWFPKKCLPSIFVQWIISRNYIYLEST